jgi:predicted DNA-binding transcriptional regulator AlpA
MSKATPMSETLSLTDAPAPGRSAADAMLIDARRLAELLGVSKPTIDRMKAAGKLPKHIELSPGCHRWRAAEVREWVEAGCPPIKEWEVRRRV